MPARVVRWSCLALLLASSAAAYGQADEPQRPTTNIGMEGVVELRWDGPPLEVRPTDVKAPMELRLAGPFVRDGVATYQLSYIGTRAGRFDLRPYLRRQDGQPLALNEPIFVDVQELLPPNALGDLASASEPPLPRLWPYRTLLAVFGIVWLAVGVRYVMARRAARPRPVVVAPPPEPTLAERLLPLVEAGLEGRLGPPEKARLEQLLIGYWRQRLALGDDSAVELLKQMREHPEASDLLAQLEAWLHCPPQRSTIDPRQLLAPYRNGSAARNGISRA